MDPWPYPGWQPQDRVEPTITLTAEYDSASGLWRYRYGVHNGPSAEQDIWEATFRYDSWVSGGEAPSGWRLVSFRDSLRFQPGGPGINATTFAANLPSEFEGDYWSASPYQIPPGQSLSGFMVESPYPPGYARAYIQGYAQVPFPPDPLEDPEAYYAANPTPHDTTNSQRRWTIGPRIYRDVLTTGDGVETTDGFMGFMNLGLTGTALRDPAPIALEPAVNGETVFPETFRAVLNGMDVTDAFHPGRSDGADLGGLFFTGNSPLQMGTNVLTTTIEGIDPATGLRALDTDVVEFTVSEDAEIPD